MTDGMSRASDAAFGADLHYGREGERWLEAWVRARSPSSSIYVPPQLWRTSHAEYWTGSDGGVDRRIDGVPVAVTRARRWSGETLASYPGEELLLKNERHLRARRGEQGWVDWVVIVNDPLTAGVAVPASEDARRYWSLRPLRPRGDQTERLVYFAPLSLALPLEVLLTAW